MEEMEGDKDRELIIWGVEYGFDIIDTEGHVVECKVKNHKSLWKSSPLYWAVHDKIIKEIQLGNYVDSKEKPVIVSPLGVVAKEDGSVRIMIVVSQWASQLMIMPAHWTSKNLIRWRMPLPLYIQVIACQR